MKTKETELSRVMQTYSNYIILFSRGNYILFRFVFLTNVSPTAMHILNLYRYTVDIALYCKRCLRVTKQREHNFSSSVSFDFE